MEKLSLSWDTLYIEKLLPALTALRENFRSGAIIFSKIVPNALKIKTKLSKTVNFLKYYLQARLRSCNFQISQEKEGLLI